MRLKQTSLSIVSTIFFTPAFADIAPNQETKLETITVQADSLSDVYSLPLANIPHTINILEPESFQDIGATRIEDAVLAIPGVLPGRSQAGISSSLIVRGFSLNAKAYIDGLLDNQNHMIRDPATIDHVEIVKGNDSVLFGSGSPGGVLNYVNKKPKWDKKSQFTALVADPRLFRGMFDTTGSISKRNDMAYRLIISAQDGKRFKDNIDDDRVLIAPSLKWNYSDTGSVLLTSEFNYQNHTFDFDNIAIDGEVIYNVSYTDPRTNAHRRSGLMGIDLTQEITPSTNFRLKANYHKGSRDDLLVGFLFRRQTETDLVGYYRDIHDDYSQYAIQPQIETSFATGKAEHELKIGLESNYYRTTVDSERSVGAFTLNPYNPVFDFPLPTDLAPNDTRFTTKEKAIFLADGIEIGNKISLTTGIRHSSFSKVFDWYTGGQTFIQSDNKTTSFSAGINYKLSKNASLFANRTESFEPNIGTDRSHNFFDPKESTQYEVGLRMNSRNKNWHIQTSVYDLTQSNLTTKDPIDRDFEALLGERQVKGVEIQTMRKVTPSIQATLAYSYMDGKITQNNDGLEGNTSRNTPRHSGTLALEHTQSSGSLAGLKTNLSINYADEREGDTSNSFKVPAYTITNMGLSYPIQKNVKFTASIQNLFDKDYVAASFDRDTIRQGNKRTITLGIDYRF